MSKTSLGRYFENIAALYLSRINYKIIDQNVYSKYGELDLVTSLQNEIVFIEIKSITDSSDYSIYQALTPLKLNKINKTAQYWLRQNHLENVVYRIEFIGIISHTDKYYLEHFKYIEF